MRLGGVDKRWAPCRESIGEVTAVVVNPTALNTNTESVVEYITVSGNADCLQNVTQVVAPARPKPDKTAEEIHDLRRAELGIAEVHGCIVLVLAVLSREVHLDATVGRLKRAAVAPLLAIHLHASMKDAAKL